ncbi:hypothetical protein PN437_00080 [Microcystis aeruginosa CS-564/01]|uniref:hypothetical protein n=1 Tax=Microcystis aeruginosa TaxID=1126 RepID=UPI00232D1FA8|nr:hypothetical protein [Microcystis aeruginosa]MDB9423350.1 hypothetical protein [Microcystis aeruginosa CS-564/01]
MSLLSILDELMKLAVTVNYFEEFQQFFEQWSHTKSVEYRLHIRTGKRQKRE